MHNTPPLERPAPNESEEGRETPTITPQHLQAATETPRLAPALARMRIMEHLNNIGTFFVLQALGIMRTRMQRVKLAVAFNVAASLIFVILGPKSSVTSSTSPNLAPMCSLPLISTLPICDQISKSEHRSPQPRFADLVEIQNGLISTLDIADLGTELTLKNTELAVRDLSILVKLSNLPQKMVLVQALRGFVDATDSAGVHISELHSGLMRAIDRILSIDADIIYSLEARAQNERENMISVIIHPFRVPHAARDEPMELFNQLASFVEVQLAKLINMATTTTSSLDLMDRKLCQVKEEVIKMDDNEKRGKDTMLSDVWTSVGGNRAELASYSRNIEILSRVDSTSAIAVNQVGNIFVQLRRLRTNLTRLREAVTESIVTNSNIGPEVYIKALREGVDNIRGKVEERERKDEQIRKVISGGSQYPELGS